MPKPTSQSAVLSLLHSLLVACPSLIDALHVQVVDPLSWKLARNQLVHSPEDVQIAGENHAVVLGLVERFLYVVEQLPHPPAFS